MDEALDTIRMAWAGGPVVKEGRNFNAIGNEPRPAPEVPIPVWIGGASDAAVKRAARAGDGWCPFFSDPRQSAVNQENSVQSIEHLRERLAQITDLRAQFGRSGAFDVEIGTRARLKFGNKDTVQAYIDEIGVLAEAGVTWTMVEPPHPSRKAWLEHVQWFGEEVIART